MCLDTDRVKGAKKAKQCCICRCLPSSRRPVHAKNNIATTRLPLAFGTGESRGCRQTPNRLLTMRQPRPWLTLSTVNWDITTSGRQMQTTNVKLPLAQQPCPDHRTLQHIKGNMLFHCSQTAQFAEVAVAHAPLAWL